jgi:Fe-S-cluster containining protein
MNRFYYQNEIKFECQPDCANCCKFSNGFVFLNDEEASRIAEDLKISEDEFLQYFTRIIDNQLYLADGEDEHCVFLENYKCNIYDVRPLQCRTYPFWPENLKSKSRWQLTKDECPGIGKGRNYSAEEIDKILKEES